MSSQRLAARETFGRRLCGSFRPAQLLRSEKWLCVARLVVASSYYTWTFANPTPLAGHGWQAQNLFGLYVLYSLLGLLRFHGVDSSYRVAALAIDLVFAGGATVLTGGPHSPFLLLWVFVVASAAYCWGLRETMLTAASCVLWVAIEAGAFRLWPRFFGETAAPAFDFERLLIRSLFLIAVGLLLGFLAEREKGLIAESNLLTQWIGQDHLKSGMDQALEAFFAEIVPLYLPLKASVALPKGTMEEVFSWEGGSLPGGSGGVTVTHAVRFSALEAVALSFPAHSWLFVRRPGRPGRAQRVLALDDNAREMREMPSEDLDSCLAARDIPSLIVPSRWEMRGRAG